MKTPADLNSLTGVWQPLLPVSFGSKLIKTKRERRAIPGEGSLNPLRGHHLRWAAVAGCRALAGGRPLAWLVIPAAQPAPADPSNPQGVDPSWRAGDGGSFIADSYYSGARSGQSTEKR